MALWTPRPRPTLRDLEIERVDWRELGPSFYEAWGRPSGRFEPEHLSVYGKSGGGKTHFVTHVTNQRCILRGSHAVAVATKKADPTLQNLGWPIRTDWPPGYGETRVIYWAKAKDLSVAARIPQRRKVRELMNGLWVENANMIVYWDELTYIESTLRLGGEVSNFYREGRTLGITNVAAMQRPSGVNRYIHSEPGWTVSFGPKDEDDRKRIAEVFGDRARFVHALDLLDRSQYEFLMRHDRTGQTYVSHLPHGSRAR